MERTCAPMTYCWVDRHPEYQVVPSKRQPLRTAPSRIRPENRRCALEEMDSRSFPQSDRAAKVAHGSVKPDGG